MESVDALGATNSSLYGSSGCTLASAPSIKSGSWGQSHYTACTTYEKYHAQPTITTNALTLSTSISYDYTQGSLPVSASDVNGQTTSTSESFEHDARGRLSAEQLQFGSLPSSWGITSSLPSYLAQYSFNDANDADLHPTSANATWQSGSGSSGSLFSQSLAPLSTRTWVNCGKHRSTARAASNSTSTVAASHTS